MKKFSVILLLMLLLLGGCNNANSGKVVEVTHEEIKAKFENKEDFIFIVAQTTCANCEEYFKELDTYLPKLPITIYSIEADKGDGNVFNEIWDKYFPSVDRTPWTLIVKKGEVVDDVMGSLSEEEMKEFLEKNNVSSSK